MAAEKILKARGRLTGRQETLPYCREQRSRRYCHLKEGKRGR
jgi:hypothetical protein